MNAFPTMRSRIDGYLAKRRQEGFALWMTGLHLMGFARFADQSGHQGHLTTELAIRWATAQPKPNPLNSAYRMGIVRQFALHWQLIEPATEIPPARLLGYPRRRLTPHIYTDEELRDLLVAAAAMPPTGSLRAKTCAAVFGLLASTGLRVSEAIGLSRADVDLAKGLLHIRHAKFGKDRWVPLHPTTCHALRLYGRRSDQDRTSANADAFFVFDKGQPITYRKLLCAFSRLRRQLHWRSRGGFRVPRIHDIRHTFVCRRLEHWSQDGLDVDANILALSTYIGHVHVTKTYWYVTATPELLAIAAQRFEHNTGDLS